MSNLLKKVLSVCVCVCECERETERERLHLRNGERSIQLFLYAIFPLISASTSKTYKNQYRRKRKLRGAEGSVISTFLGLIQIELLFLKE